MQALWEEAADWEKMKEDSRWKTYSIWCAIDTIISLTSVHKLLEIRSETRPACKYEYIERAMGGNQRSTEIGQVSEGHFKEFYPA